MSYVGRPKGSAPLNFERELCTICGGDDGDDNCKPDNNEEGEGEGDAAMGETGFFPLSRVDIGFESPITSFGIAISEMIHERAAATKDVVRLACDISSKNGLRQFVHQPEERDKKGEF